MGSSIGTAADGIARYFTNFKVRVSGPDVPAGMQALINEITQAVSRN
ncbi:MAG: hypothetical protein KGL54_15180 [Sphingomonadales bacterium]|nr:hypothetical protein [Sphingomonadales bacterium]